MTFSIYQSTLVADFFRSRSNEDDGDLLSNLKLQKLCYYAAGLTSALRPENAVPLFKDSIEAWQHGPVVPTLYRSFREYGAGSIPPPDQFDRAALEVRDSSVLDDVYNFYGQFSAWKLRDMTHEETPWKDAIARANKTIRNDELRAYFLNEVSEDYIKSYDEAGPQQ